MARHLERLRREAADLMQKAAVSRLPQVVVVNESRHQTREDLDRCVSDAVNVAARKAGFESWPAGIEPLKIVIVDLGCLEPCSVCVARGKQEPGEFQHGTRTGHPTTEGTEGNNR